ncbi:MAG TPA: NUDIX domain-containing protein [Xanthobacteraceae bacterium]|nr:NUDIX domain-containing protein [Xanthobacteraceae bacterium]
MVRKVVISGKKRVFDSFFKIDEFSVSHEQLDGTMSADQRRLVFERGDSVAVLLLNLDSRNAVLVRQFKLPALIGRRRDFEATTDGWITEAIAGMINENETPEATAIRETMEETGYQIHNPRLIAKFFSSPGGTSERIFLYFAEVRDSDRSGPGGGLEDEDIEVLQIPLGELFRQLRIGSIEDPKLIIAGYWLQDYLKSIDDLKPAAAAAKSGQRQEAAGGGALTFGTVRYAIKDNLRLTVGYKTGDIENIKGVSLWVNSENQDMLMDRFIGKTISANIRRLGSNKSKDGTTIEDTIHESLRTAIGQRQRVAIGTVLDTVSGALRTGNGVMRILHVASVRSVGDGRGVRAEASDLEFCVKEVLREAERRNQRLWSRFWRIRHESILFPMLGAGDGGLPINAVAETIIPVAIKYLQNNPASILSEIYFLAYASRDAAACDRVLEEARLNGTLVRLES